MCNCKKELEEKLTERFKGASPEAADHSVKLQGYGFVIIGNTMKHRGYMEYKTFANVTLKKGGLKSKKTTGSMFFSFCPFCGVSESYQIW